ncbi:MAG: 50S ribosomal protein L7/L12 [Oscillospiraceae bacterium]|nr:50S ribosomal protein L7/L12 [Oscillospiraceae bacterium]
MSKITAIVDEIKALSLLEVKELTDALKETFGVEAIAMGAGAGPAVAAEPVEEKTEFDVVLAGLADPKAKIKVIKIVREITGLGLADAKAAVENAPTTLKEAASKEDADALKEKVEAVGGKVELK